DAVVGRIFSPQSGRALHPVARDGAPTVSHPPPSPFILGSGGPRVKPETQTARRIAIAAAQRGLIELRVLWDVAFRMAQGGPETIGQLFEGVLTRDQLDDLSSDDPDIDELLDGSAGLDDDVSDRADTLVQAKDESDRADTLVKEGPEGPDTL